MNMRTATKAAATLLAAAVLLTTTTTELFAASDEERTRFAALLERTYLSSGVSVTVMAMDRESEGMLLRTIPMPTLLLHGVWTKASVFLAASEHDFLNAAKILGFRSVVFYDSIEGFYTFDLSGAQLPRCANYARVCL
jgi:hypothetical protein